MVRIYVVLGGLLAALLLAAFVGPVFVDWTQYRTNFERAASEALGRDVRVGGDTSARLLPFPSVTFEDVLIAEAGGIALDIERFEMDLELAPFLRGEYLIFDMRLVSPRMRIAMDREGRLPDGSTSRAIDGDAISIERLEIVDGTVRATTATGTAEATDVDFVVRADTLRGPWTGAGAATVVGERLSIDLATGRLNAGDTGSRVLLTIDGAALPLPIALAGTVAVPDGVPRYEGDLTAGRAEEPRIALTGKFIVEPSRLEIDEYRFAIGARDDPYVIVGEAAVVGGEEPQFDVSARGQRLETERVAPDALPDGPAFVDRFDALERLVGTIPELPIRGSVDISLPAIVLPNGVGQNVRLTARSEGNAWTVERASMVLPGRTRLDSSGTLRVADGLRYEGDVAFLSRQPTGLAAWLGNPADDSLRELDRIGLGGSITLERDALRMTDLRVLVGPDELVGSFVRIGDETNLILDTERVDLEAARSTAKAVFGDPAEAVGGANFSFTAKAASIDGVTANGVEVAGTASTDAISLQRLAIDDLAGAELELTGAYALGEDEGAELNLKFEADEPEDALRLLAERTGGAWASNLSERGESLGPLRGNTELAWLGSNAPIGFEAGGRAGGIAWNAGGTLVRDAHDESGAMPSFEIATATGDLGGDVTSLLEVAGLPAAPRVDERTASLDIEYQRTADGHRADIAAVSERDTASVTALSGADGAFVRAKVEAGSAVPYASALGSALAERLDLPIDGVVEATNDGAFWSVQIEELQIAESLLTGRLIGSGRRWQGNLGTGTIDLPSLARLPLGTGATFTETPLPPLDLLLSVDARVASLPLGRTLQDATMQLRVTGDAIAFENLNGTIDGGTLSGNVSVRNAGEGALISATGTLENARTEVLPERVARHLEDGTVSGDLSVEATGESLDGLLRSATGAGTVTIVNPTIAGIDPFAMGQIYEAVDALDEPPSEDAVRDAVRRLALDGRFEPSTIEANVSVGSGSVRVSVPPVGDEGTELGGRARLNLVDGQFTSDLDIVLGIPDDRGAGGNPAFRISTDSSGDGARIDVGPLTGVLNLRAFEIERDRVAALRASLIERQRLRRESLLFGAREREALREAEEARLVEAAAEAERARDRRPSPPPAPTLDFSQEF